MHRKELDMSKLKTLNIRRHHSFTWVIEKKMLINHFITTAAGHNWKCSLDRLSFPYCKLCGLPDRHGSKWLLMTIRDLFWKRIVSEKLFLPILYLGHYVGQERKRWSTRVPPTWGLLCKWTEVRSYMVKGIREILLE